LPGNVLTTEHITHMDEGDLAEGDLVNEPWLRVTW